MSYPPPPAAPRPEQSEQPEPSAQPGQLEQPGEQTRVLLEHEPAAAPPATAPAEQPPARSRPSVSLTLPRLPARVAAALVGFVVALTGVLMTWMMLLGCTAVRGVSSCGGVGLLGVLVVVVVQVLVGAVLLAALHVTEPRSTSVLGVGILSVLALLMGYASTPSLVLALALLLLAPAAYVVAAGVTGSSFVLRD